MTVAMITLSHLTSCLYDDRKIIYGYNLSGIYRTWSMANLTSIVPDLWIILRRKRLTENLHIYRPGVSEVSSLLCNVTVDEQQELAHFRFRL